MGPFNSSILNAKVQVLSAPPQGGWEAVQATSVGGARPHARHAINLLVK